MTVAAQLDMNLTAISARTGTGDSDVFAIPPGAKALSWSTSFDVAPAAISITIKTSLDGTIFTTLDTTTAVGGELRTKTLSGERFFKLNVGTNTGDRAVTALVRITK